MEDPSNQIDVVVLLHGIRTRAFWYDIAKELLSQLPNVEVKTIGYGRFDAFRFLLPFTRSAPKHVVLRELRAIRWALQRSNTKFRISVLAHSFGTYNIIRILEDEADIDIHHLILCGSVVSSNYDFGRISRKISGFIPNDAGVRDIWPLMAKVATFGYGDSGTFGFLKGLCTDRFHDFKHSDFFSRDFMTAYWVPIFAEKRIIPSGIDRSKLRTPPLRAILSLVPASFVPVVLIPLIILLAFSPIIVPKAEAFLLPLIDPQSIARKDHLNGCRADVADSRPEDDEGVLTNYPSTTQSEAENRCAIALNDNPNNPEVESLYARSLIKSGKAEKALAYFTKAAEGGDKYSIETLAKYYSNYREPNESKSIYYFTLLASKGEVSAYVRLGNLFETGIFHSYDYVKAASYYRLASEKGDAQGSYRLGQLYQFGLGVPQNVDKARDLYRTALIGGVDSAEQALNRINKRGK